VTLSPWGVTEEQIEANTHHYIIFDESSDWNLPRKWKRASVDPVSVGQWTGLFDVDKKRIYEGDVEITLFSYYTKKNLQWEVGS
jgi:hypothetical protein